MTETEKRLIEVHGSTTLNTVQLAKEFHKANAKVVRDLIYRGDFPVRTYKLGNAAKSPIVADVADVAAYQDSMRDLKREPLSVRGQGAYISSGSASRGGR